MAVRPESTRVLILPGINDSGPGHWQSRWEISNPDYRRVAQRDWENPVCSDWQAELEKAVASSGPGTVLAAHSLGCLLAVHWAANTRLRIEAALLVAPPDPTGPLFPPGASGFSPVSRRTLPFRSIVVASADDPYGSLSYALDLAAAWGSALVSIGAAGHINAESGLGDWDEGHGLLRTLMADSLQR